MYCNIMFWCGCIFFFFLNVYEILSSCHCIICTIVTLKLRTCCVEVNCIAFLKDAHLLVYFYTVKQRWSPRGRPWPRGHILKSLALTSKLQVLGLGLEASSPRKLPCPRLEDSTIF